jgi:hypothetical protein
LVKLSLEARPIYIGQTAQAPVKSLMHLEHHETTDFLARFFELNENLDRVRVPWSLKHGGRQARPSVSQ